MGNLSFTVTTRRPRTVCRDDDESNLVTRSNGGWNGAAPSYDVWDASVISQCDSMLSQSDATIASSGGGPSDTVHHKFLCLGLAGWVDNVSSYHTKLLSAAKALAQTPAWWAGWPDRRDQALALAYAYDFLRTGQITFPEADRKIIGDACLVNSTRICTFNPDSREYIDGHSRGNMAAQLLVAIALHGESGSGYNYTSAALTQINASLDFWYGATPGGPAALDTDRYFSSDGGNGKGVHYGSIAMWHVTQLLMWVHNGMVRNTDTANALQLLGEDYAPFDESWVGKAGEWFLRTLMRGDGDILHHGDTTRISSPWVSGDEVRLMLAVLIRHGGAWRGKLRWLWEQLNTHMTAAPPNGAGQGIAKYHRVHEFVFWDPADSGNAVVVPTEANTPLGRMFSPWGDFSYRTTWTPKDFAEVHITGPEDFYEGHNALACGGMQILVKGDGVLPWAGRFSNSDGSAQTAGHHNRHYYQQSIAFSGCVGIHNPADPTPHSVLLKPLGGGNAVRTNIPDGLGGQRWKQYNPGSGNVFDPKNINEMRFDGSGLAWRRAGSDATGTHKFRLVTEHTNAQGKVIAYFLHADFRRAYLTRHTDFNTAADRLFKLEHKWLVITDVWQWPVVLHVVWVQSRQASYVKRYFLHFNSLPNVTNFSSGIRRFSANGARSIGHEPTLPRAKIYVDSWPLSKFTFDLIGTNQSASSGYFADQFAYVPGGTQYPPLNPASTREQKDLGRYRIDVRPVAPASEDFFAHAYFPMLQSEEPPNYTWVDDQRWFGLDFAGKRYLIDKTAVVSEIDAGEEEDLTPPPPVVLQSAVAGPGSGRVTCTVSPSTAQDIKAYRFYYREHGG